MPYNLKKVKITRIPGFWGYGASRDGCIWSCRTNGGKIGNEWKQLKGKIDKDGYREIGLWSNGKQVFKKVHQWMMLTFVGPPEMDQQVRHKNGIRADVRIENLEYGTCLDNQRDRAKHGTDPKGERHPRAKFTEGDILSIRQLAETIHPVEIAWDFGTTLGYVNRILARKVWSHI